MSKYTTFKIKCPKCNKEKEVKLASSLNQTLDPDSYDKVVNYSEMIVNCEECGFKGFYDHDLLYHDMDKHFMVLYSSNPISLKEFVETNQKLNDTYKLDEIEEFKYLFRYCDNYPDFVEKVMTLNQGYNDYAVELYKFYIYDSLSKKSEKKIDMIHYYYDDEHKDQFEIKFVDGKYAYCQFIKEQYEFFKERTLKLEYYNPKEHYIINPNTLIRFSRGNYRPLHEEIIEVIEENEKQNQEKKEEK